jgi:hypothetical protein
MSGLPLTDAEQTSVPPLVESVEIRMPGGLPS